MRTVVIGAAGQLGTALVSRLEGDVIALDRHELDVTDLSRVRHTLTAEAPDLVVNAAAYNLVDRAEDEPDAAYAVNALGPRNLAIVCGKLNIALVHVSSDYVFGFERGRAVSYAEDDVPGPLGAYGVSKLAGKYFVLCLCPMHYVLRTCGLYGKAEGGGKENFVDKMLRIGSERKEVAVVDDHECTPTSAADLARAIADLVKTGKFGLYHATNSGSTTWYRFAVEIFRLAGMKVQVRPIASTEFEAKARRPLYSVLDTRRLSQAVGYALPPWEAALAAYLTR